MQYMLLQFKGSPGENWDSRLVVVSLCYNIVARRGKRVVGFREMCLSQWSKREAADVFRGGIKKEV